MFVFLASRDEFFTEGESAVNHFRYFSVVILLCSTVVLLHAHDAGATLPSRQPLSYLPHVIDGLDSSDSAIDQSALDILGSGEFLSRVYGKPGSADSIDLFIGYFPSQRTSTTIHSPLHCLPGAGWSFLSSSHVEIKDSRGKPHRVGEYVIDSGDSKAFVIYWYYAHGRSVASEYLAKYYLLADAIRTNRTDGSLIRVITPIGPGGGIGMARARAESFTRQLFPMLPTYIPN